MKIRVAATPGVSDSLRDRILRILTAHPGYLVFSGEDTKLHYAENPYEWDSFFAACNAYRRTNNFSGQDFLIVLTELNNQANWFSMFSLDNRTAFVHVNQWENYIYAETEYPIVYQIIENILQRLCFERHGKSFLHSAHEMSIGCMNDMCGWKPDIRLKLRTADICPDCLEILRTVPDNQEIVGQAVMIFESIRIYMLYTAQIHGNKTFEINLPFPVAITRRKLSTTSEPLRKVLMLIDHFDSLIRMAVLMLIKLTPNTVDILQRHHLNDRPALGNWVMALAELAQNTQAVSLAGFEKNIGEVLSTAEQQNIVNYRNELRGHNYTSCNDNTYSNVFVKLLPVVNRIEGLLSGFFTLYKYYYVKQCNRIHDNQFIIRIVDLSGSDTAFIEKELTVNFPDIYALPCYEQVHLVTATLDQWISLSPYLEYQRCDLCQHERVLVYEGRYKLDPFIGHRFEIQATA